MEKALKLWNPEYVKVWIGNFLTHIAFTLIVPLLPLYLSETFGATKDTIGAVLAGYSVVAILVRPISGFLVDGFPRKAVLLICNFIFCSLFIGYLAAGSLTMFAIFRTLHGAPYGAVTVSASTVAIDTLPSSRRTEGIGYYGLSNNLATAIGPILAIFVLKIADNNFDVLFAISMATSLAALIVDSTIRLPKKDYVPDRKVISLDRFFLLAGGREALGMLCMAFGWGVLSTYVAIYGKEELGITSGTGVFFTLVAVGLILSRLTGVRALRENRVSRNALMGILVSLSGYIIFACFHTLWSFYLTAFIIGLGNGHMYPAYQTMFINLAPHNRRGTANSTAMTAWDFGVGLGVLFGGLAAENSGYHAAFTLALAVNVAGTLYYLLRVRSHFEKNKLR